MTSIELKYPEDSIFPRLLRLDMRDKNKLITFSELKDYEEFFGPSFNHCIKIPEIKIDVKRIHIDTITANAVRVYDRKLVYIHDEWKVEVING